MIDSQNFIQAKSYHDLQGLESLKKTSQKTDDPAALKEAAKHFEAFFLQMILKSARESNYQINGEEGIFNSQHMKFYQDMLDEQMSVEVSVNANGGKGLGIADMLTQQLTKKVNTKEEAQLSQASEVKNQHVLNAGLDKRQVVFDKVQMPDDFKVVSLKQTVKYQPQTQQQTLSANLIEQNAKLAEKNIQENTKLAVNVSVNKQEKFKNPMDFVQKIYPIAQKVASGLGLDPKVLLAQSALETGWGKFVMQDNTGDSSYNLFGIKADSRWKGKSAASQTMEFRAGKMQREVAEFRSYDSFEQSMEDYVSFLKSNPRYKQALANKDDAKAFTGHLQKAGYATDPKYAAKIMNILDTDYFKDLENLRF